MPYSFRSEQCLPYPVETVFAFFADPENLPALMPPWQRVRIERLDLVPPPPSASAQLPPPAAGAGSRIVLSLRPLRFFPLRVRWVAEIVEFEMNQFFCDRQVSGPFAYWQHKHQVRAVDHDGSRVTLLTDEVGYELPFGALGAITHRLVRRQMEQAFTYRREQTTTALARSASSQVADPRDTPTAS